MKRFIVRPTVIEQSITGAIMSTSDKFGGLANWILPKFNDLSM